MPFDPVTYKAPVVDADGEVLLRAAEIIEQRGWVQFYYNLSDDGPTCMMGAVRQALCLAGEELTERKRFVNCMSRLGFTGPVAVAEAMGWNDHQESAGPVLARLRSAAVQP